MVSRGRYERQTMHFFAVRIFIMYHVLTLLFSQLVIINDIKRTKESEEFLCYGEWPFQHHFLSAPLQRINK